MNIGNLDQPIIFKSLSETQDEFGQAVQSYTTVDTVWGYVITQRGSEAFESARTNAREIIRVLVRYRTDVTTKWIITWENQDYNVTAIDRSKRRDGELWLTAETVGAL